MPPGAEIGAGGSSVAPLPSGHGLRTRSSHPPRRRQHRGDRGGRRGRRARSGFSTVWTTDHVLVDHASADEYGRIFDVIITLAHVGARHPRLKLGTSVIVVPQRGAVVLAKELATLDALTRRPGHRRGRDRLERDRVREPRRGGPLPRPGRLPRRGDRPLAPSLEWLPGAVPRSLPRPDRLRLRAPPPPGRRPADRRRRSVRGRPPPGRSARRRLPAHIVEPEDGRRAPGSRPGRGGRRRPAEHPRCPPGSGSSRASPSARARATPCAARPDEIRTELDAWKAAGAGHLALYFDSVTPEAIVRDVEWWTGEFGVSR